MNSSDGVNQDKSEPESGLLSKETAIKAAKTEDIKKPYNLINELMKGLAAICLLVSILATIAMVADLYFNDAFQYFTSSFFGQNNIIKYGTEKTIEPALTSKKADFSKKSTLTEEIVFEIFDDKPDTKKQEQPELKSEKRGGVATNSAPTNAVLENDNQTIVVSKNNAPNISVIKKTASKIALPKIAIIIDDIGFDITMADAISHIDKNLTISIIPGSPSGRQIAKKLHAKGVEIILHQPMEPLQYPSIDPGYGAILSSMTSDDILKVLNKNLDLIPQASGMNNHMGSKLTPLSQPMQQIFTVLKKRELFFIDSLTSKHSTGRREAALIHLPFASRDVFLDNCKDKKYIKKQLEELLIIAKQRGRAIAIGHPYSETYLVLKEEMPVLQKSVSIVPVSQLTAVK
ncbi:MAG: divergent polysaccharide deacetylase family protein [Desulfamplus sp.]|nr:divergent polysaccharide deacetylase family protein [Desulfamplus sp.]